MRYVLDVSVAEKWYVPSPDTVKALNLRMGFHTGVHELLAPDIFPAECADALAKAERHGVILPGDTAFNLNDLLITAIRLHASFPLLPRAAAIALSTRLTVFASLYVALAEREKCELLSADLKMIRKLRTHFPFVRDFASIP